MKVEILSIIWQAERAKQEILMRKATTEIEMVDRKVAELKKAAVVERVNDGPSLPGTESSSSSTKSTDPTKGSIVGGQNSDVDDTSVYSNRFPWKTVVSELMTHCQPRDLVVVREN